jgi:hypothetical protein
MIVSLYMYRSQVPLGTNDLLKHSVSVVNLLDIPVPGSQTRLKLLSEKFNRGERYSYHSSGTKGFGESILARKLYTSAGEGPLQCTTRSELTYPVKRSDINIE